MKINRFFIYFMFVVLWGCKSSGGNEPCTITPRVQYEISGGAGQPHPTDYPAYLNTFLEIDYMNLSDFMNQIGTWTPIYRVTPDDTGYPRNHNATLLRDNYGYLQDWKEPVFYFTVSRAAPTVQPSGTSHAEWTYHIWKSKVVEGK